MKILFFTLLIIGGLSCSAQKIVEAKNIKIKQVNNEIVAFVDNDTIPFTGVAIIYYDNSQSVMTTIKYDKGHCKNGKVLGYYKEGGKQYEYQYGDVDGMEDGPYTEWFENGSIKVQGQFKEGAKDGLWIYFDQNGVKLKSEKYKDDEQVL